VTRRPLIPDAERAAEIRRQLGLNDENLPISLSPEERAAADRPGLPQEMPMSSESPSTASTGHKPLVPAGLVPIALAIGGLCVGAAGILPDIAPDLPAWIPFLGATLGLIALYLGGQGAPAFRPNRPLVPLALVPLLGSLSATAATAASQLEPGALQGALLAASALLAWAAGKVTPTPTVSETD